MQCEHSHDDCYTCKECRRCYVCQHEYKISEDGRWWVKCKLKWRRVIGPGFGLVEGVRHGEYRG